MSIFCSKKLSPPVRVGTRLKNERERKKISLNQATQDTHIGKKYLEAIESGLFYELPQAVAYRLAYVRQYADWLKLDTKNIIHQFKREGGLDDIEQKHPHKTIPFSRLTAMPFLIRNIVLILLVLLFAGYLIWQVRGVLNPPLLEIYSPPEGFITSSKNIPIEGKTEPECQLLINGQSARPDEIGHFSVSIDLTEGVNTITVAAIKKHGKTTTETRHVVVRGQ